MSADFDFPRIGCAHIPEFALRLAQGRRSILGPLALVESVGDLSRLRAVSAAASAEGVEVGMVSSRARRLSPALTCLPWDEEAQIAEARALADRLDHAAPGVVPLEGPVGGLRPGLWWFDPRGMALLGGEEALARRLRSMAAQAGWSGLRVAIADVAPVALAMARGPGETHIVPTGEGARCLRPLPLSALELPRSLSSTLISLGLTTIGALADLPPQSVEERFGPEGRWALESALGVFKVRPGGVHAHDPSPARASRYLDQPIARVEHLLFTLRGLTDAVAAQLMVAGRAAADLTLTLDLHDRTSVSLPARLGRASAEARLIFERLRDVLTGATLEAPVVALTLEVSEGVHHAPRQMSLGARRWSARAVEGAVARIQGRCGAEVITVAEPTGDPRPERAARWRPIADVPSAPFEGLGARAQVPPMGLRRRHLPSPRSVEVATREGAPTAVRLDGRWRSGVAHGPERLSGQWWSTHPFAREDWRLSLEGGGTLWLARAAVTGRWHLWGWFD